MTKVVRPLSESQLGPIRRTRGETLVNGLQDHRRIAGKELGYWYQALARSRPNPVGVQDGFNANLWFVGDSMTECYGTTDDYHRWVDLVRQAIQSRYRSGGTSYNPIKHAQGFTWPYTANPDGKNIFSVTAGAETDNVDYGYGIGRRDSWMAAGCVRTGTIDCDRFCVVYVGASGFGTLTVDVDAGTPFAQQATINTAATVGMGGRVWDSSVNGGLTLTQGTHVVKLTSAGANGCLVDGVMVFYTDATTGVHTFEGGHSGYLASHFDGTAANSTVWADMAYQPYTPTLLTDFVGNGTTTVTSASAAFTTLDIGEYIFFPGNGSATCTNSMARIVARASGTSVTVDRTVLAGTWGGCLNRAQFTDASITSASTTMTSASLAAFNPWDVGMYVQGPTGIPAGTFITRWNSATSVELSNAATATQAAQTVRVLGRQRLWMAPDCITLEFGINDRTGAVIDSFYKASLRATASLAAERAGIGYPVGYTQRYTPSVVLLGMWAPYVPSFNFSAWLDVTTSGSPVITSTFMDFDPTDVGKTINSPSNTPIPAGTTVLSVQSNQQATLSQNCVATTSPVSPGYATIVTRGMQDKHWQRFRIAQFELATEMGWRFFDLYSMGGYIGANDPLNLTYDKTHPNNHGAQWVADEFDIVITGQPKNAAIPQGVMDAKGDLIVATGADVAAKLSAGPDGQSPVYAAAATTGMLAMDSSAASAIGQVTPVIGSTTAQIIGLPAATVSTATNADDSESAWLNFATSTTQFNAVGIVSAAFTVTRAGRLPSFSAYIKTDPSVITSVAYAIGLSSASLDVASAVVPAAAVQGAYFLYNTTAHGSAFWRTVTSNGTSITSNTTTTAIAANASYRQRIVVRGVRGTSVSAVDFYINDVLVATHTTNLPVFSTPLGYSTRVEALAAVAARNLKVARIGLSGP